MAQLQTKQHMVSINWEAEQEEHYDKIKKKLKGGNFGGATESYKLHSLLTGQILVFHQSQMDIVM